MTERVVYLLRGLPSCGKSHMARRLVGATGVALETDQHFYTQVGEDPGSYDYHETLLPAAHQWNLDRFRSALEHAVSPIVVDRGNGLNQATRQYLLLANEHHYQTELREPDSPWWQELRVLLKYKDHVGQSSLLWSVPKRNVSHAPGNRSLRGVKDGIAFRRLATFSRDDCHCVVSWRMCDSSAISTNI